MRTVTYPRENRMGQSPSYGFVWHSESGIFG
jgi:hypothetical protein